ncbi:MAG TPA: glycosyltransferase family 2 protein [Gaiellaceae bacterium]|nr:glycosyltransferase family 2 protein [Gaiellaceae bacterium]
MIVLKALFWGSLGALAWTHAGYPAAAAVAGRLRPKRVRKEQITPSVTVIVPAYNEETVIRRRLENLLELDYPDGQLAIVVTSDASEDRTDEIVTEIAAGEPRVSLRRRERAGKLPGLNRTVAESDSEIVAFTDANTTWAPDALVKLVRNFADDDIAYVCGRLTLLSPDGANREGVYWRYELWLRDSESRLGSITGGNGSIYAIRRTDYAEAPFGHDLSFPPLVVKRGRRAVYDHEAVAYEKPTPESADEFRRKVRMLPWSWGFLLSGNSLRGVPPVYALELVSHRHLRYASGALHVVLLATNIALVGEGPVYQVALGLQAAWLLLAAAGRLRAPIPGAGIAHYYLLMTTATLASLVRYLRSGASLTWEKAEGTR